MGTLFSALGNSSRAWFQAVLPTKLTLVSGGRLSRLGALLSLFSRSDEQSESLLAERFFELQIHGDLSEYEAKALSRLRDLMALRSLAFGRVATGKARLRQAYVLRQPGGHVPSEESPEGVLTAQNITESATVVADLYWKLYETCLGGIPELRTVAMQLYFGLFGAAFDADSAKIRIGRMTDAIQRDGGVPFLVLGFLRQGALAEARQVGRYLLVEEATFEDENLASGLYWLAELTWFQKAWAAEPLTHESTLRFLYHLCFTSPDRGGFLEIDSQFYSEFQMVNELAGEAFSYRETLMETFLSLWGSFEGDFDGVFQKACEAVAGRSSKIYDHRASWEKLWKRSQEAFSKDYLFVVEGNECFINGMYAEAAECYELALELNPDLRAASYNLLFAYSKLGRDVDHAALAERLTADRKYLPAALYVAANSYLLAGDEKTAKQYSDKLRKVTGWENRVDHYVSTFCFQHGLYENARAFAERAFDKDPADTAMAYHLSVCQNAMGEKAGALRTLNRMRPTQENGWMHFYRFTLERDLGLHAEAAETLKQIPVEYFEDPHELEAALSYARGRQDLGLMRHLRKKDPR